MSDEAVFIPAHIKIPPSYVTDALAELAARLPHWDQIPEQTKAKLVMWMVRDRAEADFDRIDLGRHVARLIHNSADGQQICEHHGFAQDEMDEHLEFMAPIVRGENGRDFARRVLRAGLNPDATPVLDLDAECEQAGFSRQELEQYVSEINGGGCPREFTANG